ncbi:YgiT-type zinc finger protein [Candidatus Protofrankia californiensis]|uniref:YgiT-type zinc finger protein n=1 Tax=Candidatus Protofrankia californiensis TaxID=1839754 RepID=UPI0013EC5319|nr:YgiT-type zinc finger protein [Candidatus Protofrankia californiensis]
MRCDVCGDGEIRSGRKPKVMRRGGRVAVVTDIPVEERPSCGMTWLDGPVARSLDDLFREMLAVDAVAIRP